VTRTPELDLLVRAPRAVLPDGERPAAVGVVDGRIALVAGVDAAVPATAEIRLGADEVLIPGLVDTHVHVNEPGRTEWEGFATATRAALAGGVTTILDMPLNSIPPTVDVEALEVKHAAAQGKCHVDVGFWGGAVPANVGRLAPLHRAGVFGFKCFLAPSGVEEFPPVTQDELRAHLREIAALDALLVAHAEDARVLAGRDRRPTRRFTEFVTFHPAAAEDSAVAMLLDAARDTGARVHVLHLSAASALPLLRAARADGVRVTVETCPHYLALDAATVPDGATQFKCCPPVRDAANQDLLWAALAAGDIDMVATDHSPSPPEVKLPETGDFDAAWGGIASLQVGLAVTWTAARRRGHSLADVVGWMSSAPGRVARVAGKGSLRVGADADLAVVAPEETFVVDGAALHHRHPVTPYAGAELHGVVRRVWLRGREPDGVVPRGEFLVRAPSTAPTVPAGGGS
jgi:allantoinase